MEQEFWGDPVPGDYEEFLELSATVVEVVKEIEDESKLFFHPRQGSSDDSGDQFDVVGTAAVLAHGAPPRGADGFVPEPWKPPPYVSQAVHLYHLPPNARRDAANASCFSAAAAFSAVVVAAWVTLALIRCRREWQRAASFKRRVDDALMEGCTPPLAAATSSADCAMLTEALRARTGALGALLAEGEQLLLARTPWLEALRRAAAAAELRARSLAFSERGEALLTAVQDVDAAAAARDMVEVAAPTPPNGGDAPTTLAVLLEDLHAAICLELPGDALAAPAAAARSDAAAFFQCETDLKNVECRLLERIDAAARSREPGEVALAERMAAAVGGELCSRTRVVLQQHRRRLERKRAKVITDLCNSAASASKAAALANAAANVSACSASEDELEHEPPLQQALADAEVYNLQAAPEYVEAARALKELGERSDRRRRDRSIAARAEAAQRTNVVGSDVTRTLMLRGGGSCRFHGSGNGVSGSSGYHKSRAPPFLVLPDEDAGGGKNDYGASACEDGKACSCSDEGGSGSGGGGGGGDSSGWSRDGQTKELFPRPPTTPVEWDGRAGDDSALVATPLFSGGALPLVPTHTINIMVAHAHDGDGIAAAAATAKEAARVDRRRRRDRARELAVQRANLADVTEEARSRQEHLFDHLRTQNEATADMVRLSRRTADAAEQSNRRGDAEDRRRRHGAEDRYLHVAAWASVAVAAVVAAAGAWQRLDALSLGAAAYAALFRECVTPGAAMAASSSVAASSWLGYLVPEAALFQCQVSVLQRVGWQAVLAMIYLWVAKPLAGLLFPTGSLGAAGTALPTAPVVWWLVCHVFGQQRGALAAVAWLLLPAAAILTGGALLHELEARGKGRASSAVLRVGLPVAGVVLAIHCGLRVSCGGDAGSCLNGVVGVLSVVFAVT